MQAFTRVLGRLWVVTQSFLRPGRVDVAQIIDDIHFRGYFFREGYIRTSSYPFNLKDLEDRDVHLTNDAVQDRNEEYGKYETGNKIS